MEVVVSEVVEVDLGEVVAAAKEIVGRFPGAATFPTRGKPQPHFWGGVTQGA